MFTGIVEAALEVKSLETAGGVARIRLDLAPLAESETVRLGDSVALNGCCLTVARLDGSVATFEAIPETLRLTNLGGLRTGSPVNIERALKAGARLDGHMVQGHVDCVGTVSKVTREGDDVRIAVECGGEFAGQCVLKGSVCIDGISLTIAELTDDSLTVAIIPHTLEVTNLNGAVAGTRVNLEADVIGKYVLKQMSQMFPQGRVDEDLLKRAGFS